MSSEDIAEEIRASFPGTEEVIVQYLSGYLVDDAGEEEDVLYVAHEILKSVAAGRDDILDELMRRLGTLLEDQLNTRLKNKSRPKLQKLDKVMDMSKSHLSSTIALSEGVDLESINKGKCVCCPCRFKSIPNFMFAELHESMSRNWKSRRQRSRYYYLYTADSYEDSPVVQAKIEKRSRRDLYEGSKLLDAHRKQA